MFPGCTDILHSVMFILYIIAMAMTIYGNYNYVVDNVSTVNSAYCIFMFASNTWISILKIVTTHDQR